MTQSEEIKVEEKPIKHSRSFRIAQFKLRQALGNLPTKPEAGVVGKHEYIRIDGCKREEYSEDKFVPSTLDLKLQELKNSGRKLMGCKYEWDGWTIKLMAPK